MPHSRQPRTWRDAKVAEALSLLADFTCKFWTVLIIAAAAAGILLATILNLVELASR